MVLCPPGWGAETNNTRKLQANRPHKAHPAVGVRGDWEDLGTESKREGRSGRDGEGSVERGGRKEQEIGRAG